MTGDILGMLAVCVALGVIFAALRAWQSRAARTPDPELVRKLAHLAAGGAAMTFPWLFDELWPGLALCAIGLLAAIVARLWRPARESVGRVVADVRRRSVGDLCLPIGIAAVWLLSGGDWVLHTIPVAFLTLGDAGAALVGRRFGRLRYRTSEGHKSVEGSSVLLVVGMVSAAAILMLSGAARPGDAVMIALALAVLVTLAEAIAWRGLDNLILPILAAVLLKIYLEIQTAELIARLVVLGVIAGGVLLLRTRTTLIAEGLIATTLFLYLYWAIGGWPWLAAPLALLLLWPVLPRPAHPAVRAGPPAAIHGVGPVLALGGGSLACLLLHAAHGVAALPVSVASLAAATALLILVNADVDPRRWPSPMLVVIAILAGAATALLPTALLTPVAPERMPSWVLLCVVSGAVATPIAFAPTLRRLSLPTDGSAQSPWIVRCVAIAIATAVAATVALRLPLGVTAP